MTDRADARKLFYLSVLEQKLQKKDLYVSHVFESQQRYFDTTHQESFVPRRSPTGGQSAPSRAELDERRRNLLSSSLPFSKNMPLPGRRETTQADYRSHADTHAELVAGYTANKQKGIEAAYNTSISQFLQKGREFETTSKTDFKPVQAAKEQKVIDPLDLQISHVSFGRERNFDTEQKQSYTEKPLQGGVVRMEKELKTKLMQSHLPFSDKINPSDRQSEMKSHFKDVNTTAFKRMSTNRDIASSLTIGKRGYRELQTLSRDTFRDPIDVFAQNLSAADASNLPFSPARATAGTSAPTGTRPAGIQSQERVK